MDSTPKSKTYFSSVALLSTGALPRLMCSGCRNKTGSRDLLIQPPQPKAALLVAQEHEALPDMFLPNSVLPFSHLPAESVLHCRAACFNPQQHVNNTPDFSAQQPGSVEVLTEIWSIWLYIVKNCVEK